ncbi:MAG: DNA/RNA non-specific endonuclease [Flavobacteriia bacterium]|jgi:endonuclease G
MILKLKILFSVSFLGLSVFSQEKALEIPHYGKHDTITEHTAYFVSYNSKYRQANWVAYQLTKTECEKSVERSNKFLADPKLQNSNNAADYKKSGYDRGHLAPAADMSFSEITMKESFYFSNMSPQTPSFNRGIWKKLEEQTRDWALEYDSLYITVGPVLNDSLCKIGPHQLAVPQYYYKVILDLDKNHQKAIAFLMENENSKSPLKTFVVSIDVLEKLTEIDFFPLVEDKIEEELEEKICLSCWGL